MSDVSILSALKFLALAIALASTVWGMTREVTAKDDEGRKRLTPAGHVAIALALGSSLVAAASYGFETVANQANARASAQAKEAERAGLFRRQQKQDADQNRRDILEATRANAEEIRDLRLANEQRDRDLALARTVNVRSAENLGRTQATLTQVQRSLYPIDQISLSITWYLPPDTPGLAAQAGRLAELARQLRIAPEQFRSMPGLLWSAGDDGTINWVTVRPANPYFPRSGGSADAELGVLLEFDHRYVEFHARSSGLRGFDSIHGQVPDLVLNLWVDGVTYLPGLRAVTFLTRFRDVLPRSPTGRIISIPDLENSLLRVAFRTAMGAPPAGRLRQKIRAMSGRLEMGGRSYRLSLTADPEVVPGYPTWHLDRLPSPD